MKIKQINLCLFLPFIIFSSIGGFKPYLEIGDGINLPQKLQFIKNDINNVEANYLINSFQYKNHLTICWL